MNPSTPLIAKDNKQNIYGLVETLTNLNPNIPEINSIIEESNSYLKEITKEIDQINIKDKLIKLAHLALLENKLHSLDQEVDGFIQKLNSGKLNAENICVHYERVIKRLENETEKLHDEDTTKADALGIVSINNLKLKNFENQINNAESQISSLERFKGITLYHLTDTINSSKSDKKAPIVEEIILVINKLKKQKKYNTYSSILLLILLTYNYITSNYLISYETTTEIEIANHSSNSHSLIENFNPELIGIVDILSSILSVLCIIAIPLFIFIIRSNNIATTIAQIVFILSISLAAPTILSSIFNVENSNVGYIEKVIEVKYELFNFGLEGSIVLFVLFCLTLMYTYFKNQQIKSYSTVADKLKANASIN